MKPLAIPFKQKIGTEETLKVSRMKPVIKPSKPHKHDNYHELILLHEGAGWHQIDADTYEIYPPVAFYLLPGQVHCWDFSKVPQGYVILFRDTLLSRLHGTQTRLYELPMHLHLETGPGFFPLLEQLFLDFQAGAKPEIMVSYLNIVLLKLLEQAQQAPSVNNGSAEIIYQFKKTG
ncbi:MAG: AraC family transcriptional regulator, partial [Bacteroidia bacterium]|nr:AraC family transcriptional regulator [Bacteroidia bacterium]